MKIGFSGVQGCGKSTLIENIKKWNMFRNHQFYGSISAELSERHIKMNKEGDNNTQLLIMNGHFGRLFTADNIIVDRCLLDGLAYTNYNYDVSMTIDKWIFEYAVKLTQEYISSYDVIFYMNDEVPLDNDGSRSMDLTFRRDIVNYFNKWISILAFDSNIIQLKGTVEQRLEQIENYLMHSISISEEQTN